MASDKKNPKRKQPTKALLRDGPNWPLFSLAALGMVLSAYLTYTAWAEKLVAFCVEGSGCDVVLIKSAIQILPRSWLRFTSAPLRSVSLKSGTLP